MPRHRIKVGIVGFGLAGKSLHAPFIQALPELELAAAVTSREIDAARFPSVRRLSSLDELLQDHSIELVVVATPNLMHFEQVLKALEAKKHVVCDKPLAESSNEVRTLARAAQKAERLLIPFQNRRWDGDFRTVAALVNSGRLGRIHAFESRWSKYQPEPRTRVAWKGEARFNGPLYDLFPHLIDQAIVLFGRPHGVFARIEQNRAAVTLPDRVRLLLDYASGLEVLLEVDQLDAFSGRQLRLRGLHGCFEKEGFDPQEARLIAGELPLGDDWGHESPELFGQLRLAGKPEGERVPTLPGDYRIFYRGVIDAIADGAAPPVSLDDVLLQAEIIEAAMHSNEMKQRVELAS
jgi:scyllo-inositol 2-dehydrogenase (NADP+)